MGERERESERGRLKEEEGAREAKAVEAEKAHTGRPKVRESESRPVGNPRANGWFL